MIHKEEELIVSRVWEWDERAQERRAQSGADEQDELDREYEYGQEHARRMQDRSYED